ncbi:MAG: hypothetical protein EBZ58_05450 [Bacteroidetes bacterium]|nr:hypothetical protein [Bacteroidota bacterium]
MKEIKLFIRPLSLFSNIHVGPYVEARNHLNYLEIASLHIKERSKELVQKAKELAQSKAPLEFNKPAIKKAVADFVLGAEKLDKMIADKAKDADIIKALSGLHDVFHQIVGLCKNPGNEKH